MKPIHPHLPAANLLTAPTLFLDDSIPVVPHKSKSLSESTDAKAAKSKCNWPKSSAWPETIHKRAPLKAALFDMDDTLFDHQHSSRQGLTAIQPSYLCLQQKTLQELERDHGQLILDLHTLVLQGIITLQEARTRRFQRLLARYGETISTEAAAVVAAHYREAYQSVRRPVPGALALLQALKERQVKIGIVTNNLAAEQQAKLRDCGLEPFTDALIVSEHIGVAKPHPAIFEAALGQLECAASEAVMIGDSWEVDILGAHQAGIRAIWLNRYGQPCPNPALAAEVHSLKPIDTILKIITT